MIRQHFLKLILGVIFIGLMAPASADTLLIEKVREAMLRDIPHNGLSMREVENRFGQPLQRNAPVGQPPITRWIYDDYSVYFEYETVIESVLHHDAVIRETRQRRD